MRKNVHRAFWAADRVQQAPSGFVDWLGGAAPPRLAVKDMIAVEGLIHSAGLPAFADRRAPKDAAAVARFRAAGYSVAGTTVTDSAGFGTITPGLENPKHPQRAVGGSSGGAAVAVALGLAEVGLGTDTGGSIRIPAAYCDLFGFKATNGRTAMGGVVGLSPTFDTLGVLADDIATLQEAAAVLVTNWAGQSAAPLSFAIDGAALAACDPHVVAQFETITSRLGISRVVREYEPYRSLAEAHSLIVCAEALATHGAEWRQRPAGFPPLVRRALAFGQRIGTTELTAAHAEVGAAQQAAREREPLILVAPSLPMPPAKSGAGLVAIGRHVHPITNANIRLTFKANVTGQPAVVAPIGGLSVQFVGPVNADEGLLAGVQALLATSS
ncbi:MAG: amidase family protein [Pseudomonadota bacterium]